MVLILIVLAFFEHDFESAGGIKNHSKVLELLYQLDHLTSQKKTFPFVVFLFVWRTSARHDLKPVLVWSQCRCKNATGCLCIFFFLLVYMFLQLLLQLHVIVFAYLWNVVDIRSGPRMEPCGTPATHSQ